MIMMVANANIHLFNIFKKKPSRLANTFITSQDTAMNITKFKLNHI